MIVSSTYTEGLPQPDGRRYVQERHVDDAGKSYEFEWLGAQDAALVLAARARPRCKRQRPWSQALWRATAQVAAAPARPICRQAPDPIVCRQLHTQPGNR